MRDRIEYAWQDAIQDAVHETDPSKIAARIYKAEIAVFKRIDSRDCLSSAEVQALFYAFNTIRILRSVANRVKTLESRKP